MDSAAKRVFLHWLDYDLRAVDHNEAGERPQWSVQGVINFPIWHGIWRVHDLPASAVRMTAPANG